MAQTNLYGPFNLDERSIDLNVVGIGPGAYALGKINNNSFIVDYVGRSDNDLNKRLKDHVGESYSTFKHAFYKTAKAAYDKECTLWHDFGGDKGLLENKVHPDNGDNKDWTCPVCRV